MKVRKAVIPTAGFGTRFLPVTRSVPKVMIPVLDTPAIHFAVEEAARAGIEHVILVISHGQEAIARYFGRHSDLEEALQRQGKTELLERMYQIADLADISYVHQKEQLGLGHAILTTRPMVGDEPFAVFLPDDIIWSDVPTIKQMIDLAAERGGSVIAVKEVPDEAVPSLGIVDARAVNGRVAEVAALVEKPKLEDAPSNLAIIGRYVLSSRVFENLEKVTPGALGEIQLTDAISMLLGAEKVFAYRFPGVHFDIGTALGLLKASIYEALQREDMAGQLRQWLCEEI